LIAFFGTIVGAIVMYALNKLLM